MASGTGNTTVASAPSNDEQTGEVVNQVTLGNIDDPLKRQVLSYPSSISNDQTFIRFKSYDYSKAITSKQVFNAGQGINKIVENVSTFLKGVKLDVNTVGNNTPALQKLFQVPSGVYANAVYSDDVIDLYVPPSVNVGYGANWGEGYLGIQGSDFQNIIQQGVASGYAASVKKGLDLALDAMKTVTDFSLTSSQLIGLTTGLIYNKNEFSTFIDMNLRTFTYSFLLVGRNESEIKSIEKIINTFKVGMHPRSSTFGKVNADTQGSLKDNPVARPPILKYPKVWTIEYFVRQKDADGKINDVNNRFIPKTKFCGIQSVNINYTPNSVFTTLSRNYNYNIPAIQMDIVFKELTPLIGDEILDSSITGIPGYSGGIDGKAATNTPGGTF